MLYRKTANGLICITQPTHAWVAGQLARAWGNAPFGTFSPWEEVCLGAEQHDIGWHRWEGNPMFNPNTGYPYSFAELPVAVSLDMWSHVKDVVMPLGRYPALLISLHGTGLFQRYTRWRRLADVAQRVEQYLQEEEAFQQRLVQLLQADPYYANHATPDVIARNHQLITIWDALSLIACMGMHEPQQIERVPSTAGETHLQIMAIDGDSTRLAIDPWPFHTSSVDLIFEGRLLKQPFVTEAAMRKALQVADWVTITTTLKPY